MHSFIHTYQTCHVQRRGSEVYSSEVQEWLPLETLAELFASLFIKFQPILVFQMIQQDGCLFEC